MLSIQNQIALGKEVLVILVQMEEEPRQRVKSLFLGPTPLLTPEIRIQGHFLFSQPPAQPLLTEATQEMHV